MASGACPSCHRIAKLFLSLFPHNHAPKFLVTVLIYISLGLVAFCHSEMHSCCTTFLVFENPLPDGVPVHRFSLTNRREEESAAHALI